MHQQREFGMGYTAKMLLLYPEKRPSEARVIWRGNEIISFGHVTRLQKLTDKEQYGHLKFDAHERAGCCVMSCFFEHLYPKFDPLEPSVFAPQLFFKSHDDTKHIFDSGWHVDPPSGEYISLASYFSEIKESSKKYYEKDFQRHNELVVMPRADLEKRTQNNWHPVIDPPFMWESCSVLAKLLDDAEQNKTEMWNTAEIDPTSLALVRAWRAYLTEVGKVNAKVLFMFPLW